MIDRATPRAKGGPSSGTSRLSLDSLWTAGLVALLALIVLTFGAGSVLAQEPDLPQLPILSSEPLGGKGEVSSLAVGDVNGDGHLDIVTSGGTSENPGLNRIYLNDGQARFGGAERVRTFGEPTLARVLALADLNGDGALDIVAGAHEGRDEVYLNDGAGGFAVPDRLGEGPGRTAHVAAGDLDGDGFVEIVMGTLCEAGADGGCSPIRIYHNDGTGRFPGPAVDVGPAGVQEVRGLVLSYVDDDGTLDIVFGDRDGTIRIYLNDGAGTFGPAEAALELGSAISARDLAAGDLDQDGRLDLIVVGEGGAAVHLLGGDRRFALAQELTAEQYANLVAAELADLNGDGFLDLVAGTGTADQPEESLVFLNDGTGVFRSPQAFGSPSLTGGLAVADLNDDGILDLVVGNQGNAQSWIYLGEPLGLFAPAVEIGEASTTLGAFIGDFGGSGYQDVLLVGNNGGPNVLYLNDGQCLADGSCPTVSFGGGDRQLSAAVADLNGDNYLDLVVGNRGANQIFLNRATMAFSGFAAPIAFGSDEPTYSLAVADMNGDRYLDVVEGNDGLDLVYLNNGRAEFPAPDRAIPLGASDGATLSLVVGDLNQDGHLDVVTGLNGQNRVLINRGNGVAFSESPFGKADGTVALALADMNGDRSLDIVVANSFSDRHQIYVNDGAGHFAAGLPFGRFQFTRGLAVDDLDGDGDLDVVISERRDTEAYLNDGRGALGEPLLLDRDFRYGTSGAALGDLDSDGQPDLVISRGSSYPLASRVALNRLRSTGGTVNRAPYLRAGYPVSTHTTRSYFSPLRLTGQYITLPYDLHDAESDAVGRVAAFYSLDGGGSWLPAVPREGSAVEHLEAGPAGIAHEFVWDTLASGVFGRSDNVVVRLAAYPQAPRRTPATEENLSDPTTQTAPYLYPHLAPAPSRRPYAVATTAPFRLRGVQVQVRDELRNPIAGAYVYRLTAGAALAELMPRPDNPLPTDEQGYLPGRGVLAEGDQLVAVLPVTPTEQIPFTRQYHLYHTSAKPREDGLRMTPVARTGVIGLVIPRGARQPVHPLLLFDLTVSTEWDAGDDSLFLLKLEEAFQRASEILFDVTNGQAALGRVHVFPAKAYWNRADVVIYASNNLRPSAAIGGVVDRPVADRVKAAPTRGEAPTVTADRAYVPGQVRMGTSWDPFGENTTDLDEQWWRALAHELAHHLLFLPDNYVGLKAAGGPDAASKRFLGRIDCYGSFMTTTRDPSYTEFLTSPEWINECQDSLAEYTTGRTDWDTIEAFYPMLRPPAKPFEGPEVQPLNMTHIVAWRLLDGRATLAARNFDLRDLDRNRQRTRLPTAQVYLFQQQGTEDESDDVLVALGSPTAGGDRVKVRGALPGDRLCLFDLGSGDEATAGCIQDLSAADVSIPVQRIRLPQGAAPWAPAIDVRAVTTTTLRVTVAQGLEPGAALKVQVFPAHYPSGPGLAPTTTLEPEGEQVYGGEVRLPYPAADVSVRIWVPDGSTREAVSQFFLRLPWRPGERVTAGPDYPVLGGAESPVLGGAESPVLGGAESPVLGGPDSPVLGGPDYPVLGGAESPVVGGPDSPVLGGADSPVVGGAESPVLGGADSPVLGGADSPVLGGADAPIILGADYPALGGAPRREFSAPVLSSDSQVVVYNQGGLFEPSGINSLQILPTPPELGDETWLVPVGQAYYLEPDPAITALRTIAFHYLQRDVPEGYEHTLAIYFLPKGEVAWQRLDDTQQFPENLVVAELRAGSGTYAVMSTIVLPVLKPGWNLMPYPLPDTRTVEEALASIRGSYGAVYEAGSEALGALASSGVAEVVHGGIWLTPTVNLYVRESPGVASRAVSFLRRGETVEVLETDPATGWHRIACPPGVEDAAACWVSGETAYSKVREVAGSSMDGPGGPGSKATMAERLEFGRVYWIEITAEEAVAPYLAPPRRDADGRVPGAG